MENYLLSVVCNFYNHAKFASEAIESFLMQKTNFEYELLLLDDFSKDGTDEIIRYYEKKFPDKIRAIYNKENQGSKGVNNWIKYQFPRAKGKYIALCDGDDYWTDQFKLQKQVDFLEQNSKCSYIFTNKKILNQDGSFTNDRTYSLPDVFDLHTLLKKNIMPSTQTVVFKKKIFPSK
jgi:glycosyltransferase involved in cell wall biosynthesis